MSRGRKPKPTVIKILEGNRGGRPLPAGEPQPAAKIPDRPAHLAAEAALEWDRITQELGALGLLTEIDRAALAAYCVCWARWTKAENTLAASGEVLKAADKVRTHKDGTTTTTPGGLYQNPWLAIATRALELMHTYLTDFGMSPAARTRVKSDKPQAGKLERFLAG